MADTEEVLLTDVSNSEALRVRPPIPSTAGAVGQSQHPARKPNGVQSSGGSASQSRSRSSRPWVSQKDPMPLPGMLHGPTQCCSTTVSRGPGTLSHRRTRIR
jgi:hypothetical protein